jgi:hypothetical protein
VAGFAGSQSAAISAAALTNTGHATAAAAPVATVVALTTNTVGKAVLAVVVGKARYALAIWPGLALMLVGAWARFAITGSPYPGRAIGFAYSDCRAGADRCGTGFRRR